MNYWLSDGYGIVPKKLMKIQGLTIYAKALAAYFLSYTGAGKLECWPTIETISNDLEIAQSTVKKTIQELIDHSLIEKSKLYENNPMKKHNKYKLTILETEEDVSKLLNESASERPSTADTQTLDSRLTDSRQPFDGLSTAATRTQNNNIYNNNIKNNNSSNNIDASSKDDVFPNKPSIEKEEKLFTNDEKTKNDVAKNQSGGEVEEIYKSYPGKCPVSSRVTGKSSKDKDKIKKILKTITYQELKETINLYLEECIKTKTYIKNFDTFLNNLPDLNDLKLKSPRDETKEERALRIAKLAFGDIIKNEREIKSEVIYE